MTSSILKRCFRIVLLGLSVCCLPYLAVAQTTTMPFPEAGLYESLYYAYSVQSSQSFALQLDGHGQLQVVQRENADWSDFVAKCHYEFLEYDAWDKQNRGEAIAYWRESLPSEVYAALLKRNAVKASRDNATCADAYPFCTDNGLYEFPAGVDAPDAEDGPDYDCLHTQPNPAWYYMQIDEPGSMDIYMYSTPQVDIDFCCWGPYSNPQEPCPNGLTEDMVVSCSYSTDWEETCEIRNASHGDFYILLITNYSNRVCNIHFEKNWGDATTDCSILPPLVTYNGPVCEGDDLQLQANSGLGDAFHWFKVGGSWTSNEQNPVIPNATPDMSGTYGCAISQGIEQSDTTYLEVVVRATIHTQFDKVVCKSFIWDGDEYTASGSYSKTYESALGCDSISTLNLVIDNVPVYGPTDSQTVCQFYEWEGETYTESGTYTKTYEAITGCDSICTLYLVVENMPTYTDPVSQSVCQSFEWEGETYTESGTYYHNYPTAQGCDSIHTLYLTVENMPVYTDPDSYEGCKFFEWEEETFTQSGTYYHTYQTAQGCDSIHTLYLEIDNSPALDTTEYIAGCDTVIWQGEIYTETGTYHKAYEASKHCDSLFTLVLDMDYSPRHIINGDHWPIGGSELHFSAYEYAIELTDPRSSLDTVMWTVDCPNWVIVPHGKGETCTLYIYSYLTEPVELHSTAVGGCGSETSSFSIKTTYFGVEENMASVTVSPNPTTGDVTIDFGNLKGETLVRIYDVRGSLVDEFGLSLDGMAKSYPYSIHGINSGLCYIVINNNGFLKTFKMLINK